MSKIDLKLTPAVLERSCPRTQLPSRAGATHALRVHSSKNKSIPYPQLVIKMFGTLVTGALEPYRHPFHRRNRSSQRRIHSAL